MGSCFFESTKYTLMWINDFCMLCSVFENDESVLKRVGKLGVRWRTASHALRENDNELNLEETDDRDERNEEL